MSAEPPAGVRAGVKAFALITTETLPQLEASLALACHGEARHELYRRALLRFTASGVPGLRRSALLLLAALVKPKSPHQTGKQKI
jgi:hypothetical protein